MPKRYNYDWTIIKNDLLQVIILVQFECSRKEFVMVCVFIMACSFNSLVSWWDFRTVSLNFTKLKCTVVLVGDMDTMALNNPSCFLKDVYWLLMHAYSLFFVLKQWNIFLSLHCPLLDSHAFIWLNCFRRMLSYTVITRLWTSCCSNRDQGICHITISRNTHYDICFDIQYQEN